MLIIATAQPLQKLTLDVMSCFGQTPVADAERLAQSLATHMLFCAHSHYACRHYIARLRDVLLLGFKHSRYSRQITCTQRSYLCILALCFRGHPPKLISKVTVSGISVKSQLEVKFSQCSSQYLRPTAHAAMLQLDGFTRTLH